MDVDVGFGLVIFILIVLGEIGIGGGGVCFLLCEGVCRDGYLFGMLCGVFRNIFIVCIFGFIFFFFGILMYIGKEGGFWVVDWFWVFV